MAKRHGDGMIAVLLKQDRYTVTLMFGKAATQRVTVFELHGMRAQA